MYLLKKLIQVSQGDKRLKDGLDLAEMIAHVLAGIGTDDENRRFREWIKETPDHLKVIERIRQEIGNAPKDTPDIEEMWEELKQRIPKRRVTWKFVLRYAALLILPLCVTTWLYFKFSSSVQEIPLAKTEQIFPGRYQAKLILANGKEVDITNETKVNIQERSGVLISSAGNTLQYGQVADSINSRTVQYNTLYVPVGGEFSLQLTDGTKVWLNSGSKLKYPVVFDGDFREVEMEGEIYFEVKKKIEQPFVVHVKDMAVTVLGTSFNISAYEHEMVTTLITGKVSLAKGGHQIELYPGEQAVTLAQEQGFQVSKVKARNFALWKDGIFWFENTDLDNILNRLARWYDVEVFYTNPELKNRRFSMEMKRYEDIATVLRKLEYTQKVKFTIDGRTVVVTK